MKEQKSYQPPADAIEALARRLYPAMVAYFESEEGQREFAEWQAKQGAENSQAKEDNAKSTSKKVA